MFKRVFVVCLIVLALILPSGCTYTKHNYTQSITTQGAVGEKCYKPLPCVSIVDKGNYYDVTLDFNRKFTHRQVGEAFARGILKAIPNYEAIVDSYIAENLDSFLYGYILQRVYDIKPQLQQDYVDEIEGMATVFSGKENVREDNKLSKDELFLFNLFPDVARGTQCCFVSVFGSRSVSHSTILGRNLDWIGGTKNQLSQIQGIIKMINPNGKLCSIGYLGYMGIITGFSDRKVFAAILDSQSGAPFTSTGKRSYPLDIRFALENNATLDGAAAYMKENAGNYTVNHLIAFADPHESKVLENNFSGNGPDGQVAQPALRGADSILNDGVSWGISNALGCVNSFMLYGNFDNHTSVPMNTLRWDNMKTQLLSKGDTVTFKELKEVASYNHGSPGSLFNSGDLYNDHTLQMVMFQPADFSLEVYFHPQDDLNNSIYPVFERIKVF